MTTLFEFAVIALPLTAAVGAMLFFGRKRIHRQMEEIAEAAKSGAFKRPLRFRPVRTLPQNLRPERRSRANTADSETCATPQPA